MSADDDAPPPVQTVDPAGRGRRGLRTAAIAAGIFAGVAALLALAIFEAPSFIARWVADHYLAGVAVDVDGVKTIDVDLPDGRFSFGPVRFHSGDADPGSIGLLGVQLSLRSLFEKQALLKRVTIENVDIDIRQAADGELSINGVSLRQILAEKAEKAQKAQQAKPEEPSPDAGAASGPGWGTGLGELGLRDVVVTFVNRDSGTARLAVSRLDLQDFRSWQPEQPGSFDLTAQINGIDLHARGTARPFAEKITAEAEFGIEGVDRQSVEAYTGPIGLERAAGSASLRGRSGFSLYPDGRLEGTANVSLVMDAVDAARGGLGDLRLGVADFSTDGRFALASAGDLTFDGTAGVKLERGELRTADGIALNLSAAELTLADLTLKRTAAGALTVSAAASLEAAGATLKGPADAAASKISLAIPRFEAAVGDDGGASLQAAAPGEKAAAAVHLELAEPKVASPVRFEAGRTSLDLADLSVKSAAGGKLALKTTATLSADGGSLALIGPGGTPGPSIAFSKFTSQAADAGLDLDAGRMKLASRLTAQAKTFEAKLPIAAPGDQAAQRIAADGIDVSLSSVAVERAPAGISVATTGTVRMAAPALALPADGATTEASAGSLQLDLASLKVQAAGERTTVGGDATLALDRVQATAPQPGAAPWTLALSRARLGLASLDATLAPPLTRLAAQLDLAAEKLVATQPAAASAAGAQPARGRQAAASSASNAGDRTRLALDSLSVSLAPVEVQQRGDRLTMSGSGETEATALAIELPRDAQNPAATAAVGSARTELTEVTFDQGGRAPAWSAKVDILADKLSSKTEGGSLASIDVQSVAIGGLQASDKRRLTIDRLVVDRLQAFVTRAYLFASATQEKSRPKEAVQAVQEAAQKGWRVRVGSTSLGSGSAIRLRDSSIDPPVNATLEIRSLQVQNLDTGDPAQRMDVRLDAAINEFTELGVSGWAAPFGQQPDFDINARLRRLELPPLSPYAAQAIGLNVESGRLGLDLSAAAKNGNLDGLLDLTLRDLDFSALSAADAERLSASVGVPIGTIVGLLQDDQGRISLSLPISGNLASPSFDPSDAIRQALAGAVQAAVLAPFQLAFAPVALLAKAAGGGGGSGGLGLKPIPFPAGEAALDSTARDMTQGLARVLQQRDKLSFKVCGRATAQDLEAALRAEGAPADGPGRAAAVERLAPDLWSLAGERTANVRSALITDEGAAPRQVNECRILYDPTDPGPPRVEVGL